MKIINVVYFTNEKQHCCPDLEIEYWFNSILSSEEDVIYISTTLQLLRLRLAIKQKEISIFDFNVNNKIIRFLDNGKFPDDSYLEELETWENFLYKLL